MKLCEFQQDKRMKKGEFEYEYIRRWEITEIPEEITI